MNPDVEYILRLILRARDEMAAVLAKAKTELRAFVTQSDSAEKSVNRLNSRLDVFDKRLSKIIDRIDNASGRLSKFGDSEERIARVSADVIPNLDRQERTTRRLGESSRRTGTDSDALSRRIGGLANTVARAGENVASLDNRLRGMIVLGALVFASQLDSALVGLVGSLASVGGSATFAGGAIAGGLVAGIAQALPMIGLLAGALLRVNQVMDAVGKLQDVELQRFGRQEQAGRRQADTANSLANAQDGVVDALKRVKEANEGVDEAQQQVNEARAQARREIEDLTLAERGAFLSEEEAQRRLQEAVREGRVGELAQLRLQVDEARVTRRRAVQDASQARQQGPERRPQVQDAERQLRDARRNVEEAEQAVVTSQRSVDQARRGAKAAAADTFAAASALDFMLQKMSPAERRLFQASRRILHTFNTDFRGVTDTIVDSFTRGVDLADKVLQRPDVLRTANRLSRGIASQFDRVFDSLGSDRQIKQFERITEAGRRNLKPLGDITLNLGHALANIAEDAGPALHQFILFARELSRDFLAITENHEEMEDFFSTGERHLEAWVRLALAVVNLFAALVGASAPSGLRTVKDATEGINDAADSLREHGKEARDFFEDARKTTYALFSVVKTLGIAMFEIFEAGGPERTQNLARFFNNVLIPAISRTIIFVGAFTDLVLKILDLPFVSELARWGISFLLFAKVVTGTFGIFGNMLGLVSHFFAVLGPLDRALGSMGGTVGGLRGSFIGLGSAIRTAFATRSFAPLLDFLRGLPGRIRGARTAAAGGVIVPPAGIDPRRGPQAPARGPQAPAGIVATGRGAAAGIGGRLLTGAGIVGGALLVTQVVADVFRTKNAFSERDQRLTPRQQDISAGNRNAPDRALESLFGAQARTLSEALRPGFFETALGVFNSSGEADKVAGRMEGVEKKVRKLQAAGDLPGLRRLVEHIRDMGDELGGGRQRLLDNFADTIEKMAIKGASGLETLRGGFRRLRQGSDIDLDQLLKTVRTNLAAIDAQMGIHTKEGREKADENFRLMAKNISRFMGNGTISVTQGMRTIRQILRADSKVGVDALSDSFLDMQKTIGRTMSNAEGLTRRGMRAIRKLMVEQMKAFGFTDAQIARSLNLTDAGERRDPLTGKSPETLGGHAGGGPIWLGNRGEREPDGSAGLIRGHPVGRGELVVANKPQQNAIDAALHAQFGFGIHDLSRKIRGAHAGSLPGGFAEGGSLFDGHPSNVAPGIVTLLRILQKRWPGLGVTSTTDHSVNTTSGNRSDHTPDASGVGHAVDVASSDYAYMNAAAAWIRSSGLYRQIKQGIHNPNLAIQDGHLEQPPGRFAGHTWTEHLNHIHLAVAGAINARRIGGGKFAAGLAGAAGVMADIKRLRVEGSGADSPLGEITQAALDKIRRAANRRLRRLAGDAAPGGGTVLHGSGDVERTFAQVARRLSRSRIATLALGMAGFAESGMRDLGYGDASSQGSLQLLASTAQGLGVSPHDEKAVASLFLTRGFYGRGGANALAAQGLPAHLVAQNVQGSAFASGSNYLAQAANARAWMKRFNLAGGGLIGGLRGFQDGGQVDGGRRGSGQLILSHVGEWVLTERHQELLAQALGVSRRVLARLLGLRAGGERVGGGGRDGGGRGDIDAAAYVGDSLGVGTMQAGLRGKMGGIDLAANVRGGRPSSEGVGVLRDLLKRKHDIVGFDLGSNDFTVGDLRSSLNSIRNMLGNRPLVMATMVDAIRQAGAKNRLIRNRADRVVDWAGVAGPYLGSDGIHANPAGYARRASMFSRALRGFQGGGIVGFSEPTTSPSGTTRLLGGRSPSLNLQQNQVGFIRFELNQISKDLGQFLKYVFKSAKAVSDAMHDTGRDRREIERLTNQIEQLRKGSENAAQKRQIQRATNQIERIRNRQEEAWKLYELHLEGLTRDGGLLDQQTQKLEAFANNLALNVLTRTFRNLGRGRVQRVLSEDQVQGRELRALRTRLPRERRFLDRLQRTEQVTRGTTIQSERVADRSERREQNLERRLRNLRAGEENKEQREKIKRIQDDLEEQRKVSTRSRRHADTNRAALTNIRERMLAQQQLLAEILQSIWEAQVAVLQGAVDRINRNTEVANRFIEGVQRTAELTGNEDLFHIAAQATRSNLAAQEEQLRRQLFSARAIGANDLADSIEDQLADIHAAIADSIQQEIADTAERVNNRAQRRLGRLDLFERMATALGQVGLNGGVTVGGETLTRASVFGQRQATLEAQRQGLQGVVAQAAAAGNLQLVQDLTDQLAELDVTIQENTKAYFDARLEDVNNRAGFNLNINDLNRQVIELTAQISGQSAQTELLRLATERGNTLQAQRIELEALLAEAQANQNQQAINDLTTQLLENQVAILQNTVAINELNGQMNEPQSFASTQWQWFRQAIFSGLGQPLPQYAVPGAAAGAMITQGGLAMTHTGEEIRPARVSRPMWAGMPQYSGAPQFNFDITEQPTETDYEYLGETIARKVKTAGY